MIWGIGLPRTGGQTLLNALYYLHDRRGEYWHSIQSDKWNIVNQNTVACVEVFAPIRWCERFNGKHKYILNYRRDSAAWFESCCKFIERSKTQMWNHPLWMRSPCQWQDYYDEYYFCKKEYLESSKLDYLEVDVTECGNKGWRILADFLNVESNSQYPPWPNIDKFSRYQALQGSPPGQLEHDIKYFNEFLGQINGEDILKHTGGTKWIQ